MSWNDTDVPIAIFFTLRTYGTWLHGDLRGSVDRHNNIYGTPRIPHNPAWKTHNLAELKYEPVILSPLQRRSVERAILDTCAKRRWHLSAINVRTNHVHWVSNIRGADPGQALVAFKSNATRQMREDGCWRHEHSPWADKGSKRWLWNEKSVCEACDYVLNRQGDALPDFE